MEQRFYDNPGDANERARQLAAQGKLVECEWHKYGNDCPHMYFVRYKDDEVYQALMDAVDKASEIKEINANLPGPNFNEGYNAGVDEYESALRDMLAERAIWLMRQPNYFAETNEVGT
jgi:hypothetical protein